MSAAGDAVMSAVAVFLASRAMPARALREAAFLLACLMALLAGVFLAGATGG